MEITPSRNTFYFLKSPTQLKVTAFIQQEDNSKNVINIFIAFVLNSNRTVS